jgi:RsmE family RNA methyltransferase
MPKHSHNDAFTLAFIKRYNSVMNIILFEENELELPLKKRDERAIHLSKVLHKNCGDEFDAGVLGGNIGKGRIEQIEKDGSIIFSVNLTTPPPSRLPIHIGVGFPRPIQLRRILRELSNIGVKTISVFGTDLGEKSYRDTMLFSDGGARAALIEGAVQSRDTILPAINIYKNTDEFISDCIKTNSCLIIADNISPSATFVGNTEQSFTVAIGSERGWSNRERNIFKTSGFKTLSLGSRALRTETACIAAVSKLFTN